MQLHGWLAMLHWRKLHTPCRAPSKERGCRLGWRLNVWSCRQLEVGIGTRAAIACGDLTMAIGVHWHYVATHDALMRRPMWILEVCETHRNQVQRIGWDVEHMMSLCTYSC